MLNSFSESTKGDLNFVVQYMPLLSMHTTRHLDSRAGAFVGHLPCFWGHLAEAYEWAGRSRGRPENHWQAVSLHWRRRTPVFSGRPLLLPWRDVSLFRKKDEQGAQGAGESLWVDDALGGVPLRGALEELSGELVLEPDHERAEHVQGMCKGEHLRDHGLLHQRLGGLECGAALTVEPGELEVEGTGTHGDELERALVHDLDMSLAARTELARLALIELAIEEHGKRELCLGILGEHGHGLVLEEQGALELGANAKGSHRRGDKLPNRFIGGLISPSMLAYFLLSCDPTRVASLLSGAL